MEGRPKPSEHEWTLEFHGYIVMMTVNEFMLALELENAETNERWSGEFTASFIENTTHKAGSVKKLAAFSKMLDLAFSKNNDKVLVDVLTFTDLELKKAQKQQGPNQSFTTQSTLDAKNGQNHAKYQKRYVIMTYRGEFDTKDVHYPLPLEFEDKPNFPALKRTIARLRRQIVELQTQEKEPSSEKERELRELLARLRQENTELKHRLRQGHHGLNTSTGSALGAGSSSQIASLNAEGAAANIKLRTQVDSLKKELNESSKAYNQLRVDATKEIAKWKSKIGTIGSPSKGRAGASAMIIADLRQQIDVLQRELKYERLHRGANASSRSGWSPSTRRTVENSTSWRSSTKVSQSKSRSQSAEQQRMSSTSSAGRGGWGAPPSRTTSRTSGIAGRSASPNVSRPSSAPRAREVSPGLRQRGSDYGGYGYTPGSGSRRSSPALSTSLGGRFDPTAYQQDRAQRLQESQRGRAWGAGTGTGSSPSTPSYRHRYASPGRGESGYNSATSQSSNGSRRSQRSTRSDSSRGASSTYSQGSQHKKTSAPRKKTSVPHNYRPTEQSPPVRKRPASPAVASAPPSATSSILRSSTPPSSQRGTRGTTRSGEKSKEIGRINSKKHAVGSMHHDGPHAAQKAVSQRSRESPDGDSSADDSDYLQHNSSAQKNRSHLQKSHEWRRSSAPPAPASAGKSTAYNTYLNVVSTSQPVDERKEESRRSHDKLVALAAERSAYLVRGNTASDDDDDGRELRRSSTSVDKSIDKVRVSTDRTSTHSADVRASVESLQSAQTTSTVGSTGNRNPPQSAPGPSTTTNNQAVINTSSSINSLRRSKERGGSAALAAVASPPRKSHTSSSVNSSLDLDQPLPSSDMAALDQRIQALQSYLEQARTTL